MPRRISRARSAGVGTTSRRRPRHPPIEGLLHLSGLSWLDPNYNPLTGVAADTGNCWGFTPCGGWATDRLGHVYTYNTAQYVSGLAQQPYGPVMGISGFGTNAYRSVGADGGVFDFNMPAQGRVVTSGQLSQNAARQIGRVMLPQHGWGDNAQWAKLDPLWGDLESQWRWNAYNPNPCTGTDHAYGIPQSCPGSKMAANGPDWQNNAWTQIMWGFSYISSVYGDPIAAYNYRIGHSGYSPVGG